MVTIGAIHKTDFLFDVTILSCKGIVTFRNACAVNLKDSKAQFPTWSVTLILSNNVSSTGRSTIFFSCLKKNFCKVNEDRSS